MPFSPGHPHLDRRIVVVDDNPKFLILMKSLLREFGFKFIHEFGDAQTAFFFMAQCHVDLVLVDLVMPRATGFQFADRVRHADVIVNRVAPLILMTGHANRDNIQKAINHGIDEVLVKPFSPRQLHDRLFGLLDKPRVYIKTPSGYFGPDRRRRSDPAYTGPERRQEASATVVTEDLLIEMRHFARVKYGRLPPSPLEPRPLSPVLVGKVTTIPVAQAEGSGNRAIVRVPTPIRAALAAAEAHAAAEGQAAAAGPVGPDDLVLDLKGAEAPPPVFATPPRKVPIAPPPPAPPPRKLDEVHFLD